MAKQQSITSLPRSPDDDRRSRMLKYSITMAIRLLCIIVVFLVPGYWIIIPAIGAIVLPYVAVVLANVSSSREPGLVRPGQLSLPPAVHEVPEPKAPEPKAPGHEDGSS